MRHVIIINDTKPYAIFVSFIIFTRVVPDHFGNKASTFSLTDYQLQQTVPIDVIWLSDKPDSVQTFHQIPLARSIQIFSLIIIVV